MAMAGFPLPAPAVDGIIEPPPNVIMIVERMAEFVAKHGPEFEKRIVDTNEGNAHFNFLNQLDPYHAYYQHRLAHFLA
ncbi:putative splicing factor 3A subunit [Trifolium repens]|jgi:splicing factor 3A subunit 1|nr:putative splicing factor 3A subunit [Trifolium repens]